MFRPPDIERLKRRRAVPKLVKILRQDSAESLRAAAARALGEIAGARAVPVLVESMATDVCPVAGTAAEAVAELDRKGHQATVEDLVEALRSSRRWHREGRRRCGCRNIHSLLWRTTQVLRWRARSAHVPLLVELLNDDDPHLRECAARVLEAIGDPAAVPPLVARLRREPYDQVPHRVIFAAIASFQDPSTLDVLVTWLANTPPLTGHGSHLGFKEEIEALYRFGPPGLEQRLTALIADRTCPRQRDALVEEMARRSPDPAGVHAAGRDADRDAEQAARRRPLDEALAAGPAGIKALVKILDADDASHRQEARRGLSALDDPRMHAVLIRLLRHPREENMRFAASDLGERGDRRAIFPLIDASRRGLEAAAEGLAGLGVDDVAEYLLTALDDPDARTRALARIRPDPRAIEPLLRILTDERLDYHVRHLAQIRLKETGGPAALPEAAASPEPEDLWRHCADMLMSTLRELRIGRDMGLTPYDIGAWEQDRRAAVRRAAGAEPAPVPGGELPAPDSRTSPDYHWDVRMEDYNIGTYFTARVNEQGLVEFGGGINGPYPADPDGWRAVVADFNEFGDRKRIRLFR